jgi:hypothetical protein
MPSNAVRGGFGVMKFLRPGGCNGAVLQTTQIAGKQCDSMLLQTMNWIILSAYNSIPISEEENPSRWLFAALQVA